MSSRYQKYKFLVIFLVLAGLAFLLFLLVRGHNFAVLNPKGPISGSERNLLVTATLLMLLVVVPVFASLVYIAWKYRASNKKARYTPNLDDNIGTQLTFWGILMSLIFVLAIINWKSTHELDPLKPLNSSVKPITIQVVALRWKWLFIYPEQNIATVNFVQFPSGTPVNFQLTADAPMNSFWIPQLGGQMYAMPGMSTRLHLEANAPGEFNGSAAEINGLGFSGMKFMAVASTQADFEHWVSTVKQTPATLDMAQYEMLAAPSTDNPVAYYSSAQFGLYRSVMMKFMVPDMEMGGTP